MGTPSAVDQRARGSFMICSRLPRSRCRSTPGAKTASDALWWAENSGVTPEIPSGGGNLRVAEGGESLKEILGGPTKWGGCGFRRWSLEMDHERETVIGSVMVVLLQWRL